MYAVIISGWQQQIFRQKTLDRPLFTFNSVALNRDFSYSSRNKHILLVYIYFHFQVLRSKIKSLNFDQRMYNLEPRFI